MPTAQSGPAWRQPAAKPPLEPSYLGPGSNTGDRVMAGRIGTDFGSLADKDVPSGPSFRQQLSRPSVVVGSEQLGPDDTSPRQLSPPRGGYIPRGTTGHSQPDTGPGPADYSDDLIPMSAVKHKPRVQQKPQPTEPTPGPADYNDDVIRAPPQTTGHILVTKPRARPTMEPKGLYGAEASLDPDRVANIEKSLTRAGNDELSQLIGGLKVRRGGGVADILS